MKFFHTIGDFILETYPTYDNRVEIDLFGKIERFLCKVTFYSKFICF